MITEKVVLFRGFSGDCSIERLKESYFVDYNIVARERCATGLAKNERNDCVVKAFMCALDCNYETAHAYIKDKMKRKNNQGTLTAAYAKYVIGKTKNGKRISFIGYHPSKAFMKNQISGTCKVLKNPKYKKSTGYTLKSFMENNPVGRFVLIVQGHAVAVIDGVLYGNSNERSKGLYRSVWFGFEMK